VVNKNAVSGFKPAASRSRLHDESGRLVPGNHALVSFGTLAKVFMIDATDIGAADRRCLYLEQYFTVLRFGYGNISYLDGTVSG
jgi:hypothetical protein